MLKSFVLSILLSWAGIAAGEIVQPNIAFWAPEIEYYPGEPLLLRPRLPAADIAGGKTYHLSIELPAELKELPIDLEKLDAKHGFTGRSVRVSHKVQGNRQSIVFKPETEMYYGIKVVPGATYTFSCVAKGQNIVGKGFEISGYFRGPDKKAIVKYPTFIGFDEGTYDWKPFTVQLKAPPNAAYLILTAIKWHNRQTHGTLYIDDLSLVCDRDEGVNLMLAGDLERAGGMRAWPHTNPLRPVPIFRHGHPGNHALRLAGVLSNVDKQIGYWLPMPIEPVKVNLDNIHSLAAIVFDVPASFKGEHFIDWSVLADSSVVAHGKVRLVPAPRTSGPEKIKFTVWLAESNFERMPSQIQEMYLKRFKRLGINGVMPVIPEPSYDTPLANINVKIDTARLARRYNMSVDCYLMFLYTPSARTYCEKYPSYWATTWTGKKTPDYRVCLTHGLDGDKYDDIKTGIKGGKDNPWLGRWYETLTRSIQDNDLQGAWWDFEIGAVPIRKERPIPYNPNWNRQVCTDLRCRRGFADFARLDHVPTVEEIMSDKFYEQWNDFKCSQHARLCGLMRQAVHEANPSAKFGLYSGPPDAYSRQAYGVDWTMAAKNIDVAMSMHYTRNTEKLARSHFAASEAGGHRNPLLMSVTVNGYSIDGQSVAWRLRPMLQNQLMQTVIDWDAMGVALTGVWGFDSQFNAVIRRTSEVFARYENTLVNGIHNDKMLLVKPEKTEYAAWLSPDGKRILGFFFNNTDKKIVVSVHKTSDWSRPDILTDVARTNEGVIFDIHSGMHKIVEFTK